MLKEQIKQLNNLVAMGKSITEIANTMNISKVNVSFELDKYNLKNTQIQNEKIVNHIKKRLAENEDITVVELSKELGNPVPYVWKKVVLVKQENKKEIKMKNKKSSLPRYTEEDNKFILESKRKGLSNREIASKLNPPRKESSLSVHYSQLRKSLPENLRPQKMTKKSTSKEQIAGLTFDQKLQIVNLWSKGFGKEKIASVLGVSTSFLSKNWDEIPGLGSANDQFKVLIRNLCKSKFTQTVRAIVHQNRDMNFERVRIALSEIHKEEKVKVKVHFKKDKHRAAWSKIEDKKILDLRSEKKTTEEISILIGRSVSSINNRFWKLDNCTIPVKLPKIESCEQKFDKVVSEDKSAKEIAQEVFSNVGKGINVDGKPTKEELKNILMPWESINKIDTKSEVYSSTDSNSTLELFKEALNSTTPNKTVVFIINK